METTTTVTPSYRYQQQQQQLIQNQIYIQQQQQQQQCFPYQQPLQQMDIQNNAHQMQQQVFAIQQQLFSQGLNLQQQEQLLNQVVQVGMSDGRLIQGTLLALHNAGVIPASSVIHYVQQSLLVGGNPGTVMVNNTVTNPNEVNNHGKMFMPQMNGNSINYSNNNNNDVMMPNCPVIINGQQQIMQQGMQQQLIHNHHPSLPQQVMAVPIPNPATAQVLPLPPNPVVQMPFAGQLVHAAVPISHSKSTDVPSVKPRRHSNAEPDEAIKRRVQQIINEQKAQIALQQQQQELLNSSSNSEQRVRKARTMAREILEQRQQQQNQRRWHEGSPAQANFGMLDSDHIHAPVSEPEIDRNSCESPTQLSENNQADFGEAETANCDEGSVVIGSQEEEIITQDEDEVQTLDEGCVINSDIEDEAEEEEGDEEEEDDEDQLMSAPCPSPPSPSGSSSGIHISDHLDLRLGVQSSIARAIGKQESTIVDGVNLEEIKEFAHSFKMTRVKLGLTQTQVHQAIKTLYSTSYSQSAICRFEKLEITPRAALKIKPVLEQWMTEAESKYQNGEILGYDDIFGVNSNKSRKKRTTYDDFSKATLEAFFNEIGTHPDTAQMVRLADELNDYYNSLGSAKRFDKEGIRVWFCNRRQKMKHEGKGDLIPRKRPSRSQSPGLQNSVPTPASATHSSSNIPGTTNDSSSSYDVTSDPAVAVVKVDKPEISSAVQQKMSSFVPIKPRMPTLNVQMLPSGTTILYQKF